MKYFIVIIVSLYFVSCINKNETHTNYDIANTAIDSIQKFNIQLNNAVESYKPGGDASIIYMALLDRYKYAKIYQMALNKLPTGDQKNGLVTRYTKEVNKEVEDFFPAALTDSVRASIFRSDTH